tara:strand:- start:238 stop:801 length:564 start_codon:yes stop_codon:yes gene_type:complete
MFSNLEQMVSELQIDLASLDILFSSVGPGNFNGIRISLSLIKGLAISNNTRLAGISSLELLSRSFINKNNKNICTFIKASPGFYYLEIYNNLYTSLSTPKLINLKQDIKFPFPDFEMVFVGNDVEKLSKCINFKGQAINIVSPTPESLYSLVKHKIINNEFMDASPQYLREVNASKPSLWKRKPIVS